MDNILKISGFALFLTMLFINAFVDLGHKIIIQNTVFKLYDGQTQIILTAIVNSLILLPFVLLFSPAGYLSDNHPKVRVMRLSAWAAVAITTAITVCYYQGWFWAAFAMTLLLATQSAFYSPAKYGYIKLLAGNEQLTRANGAVQATTTVAILAGIFVFSLLFEQALAGVQYTSESQIMITIAPIGWLLIGLSLLEVVLAYRLPCDAPAGRPQTFDWRGYRSGILLRRNLRAIRKNRIIWLSIVGLAMFWAISQVVLAAFPAFAKTTLAQTNTVVIQGLLACSGIGIVIGALLAGRASKRHIETGLIPLGAAGIVICLFALPHLQSQTAFALAFVALGMLGGLFIVPLNALIQFHAGEEQLGTVLAGNNWLQNVTMLAFLCITVGVALVGLNSAGLFYLMAMIALGGMLFTLYKLPQSLLRYLIALIMQQVYRVDVVGLKHLPEQGAVLMLGNHVSWIDWAIVQIASPRPVRFVMHRHYYDRWYLRWFLDLFGVIPITHGASKGALAQVNALLRAGEVVCLFPEGGLTRNGQLSEFYRGYERAVDQVDGVILPFYLHGLWSDSFSRASDKLRATQKRGMKRHVIVAYGTPLPITATAHDVKQAVFNTSSDAWQRYTDSLRSIPFEWFRSAKRMGNALAVADTAGTELSHHKLLAAAIMFSRLMKTLSPEQHIGLLLPTTSAGLIANMAALIRGKTVVNLNYSASLPALQAAIRSADIKSIYTSRQFVKRLERKGIQLNDVFANVRVIYLEDITSCLSIAGKLLTLALVKLLPANILYALFAKNTDVDSAAAILFSSGSEGTPKGIVLSHRNILANTKQVSNVLNAEHDDVVIGSLPLFHAFGLTVTGFMPLLEGLPVVCHPDPTDALNIAKAIAKYNATLLCGTSTFLRFYIKNRKVNPQMLESLRIVVAGAEKLSDDVREGFKLKFGKDIYEGYGATETAPVASVNIPDKLNETTWKVQLGQKCTTVGMPLPGTTFKIVDPTTLHPLPLGEEGLILVAGPQVMSGYLNDAERTREALQHLNGKHWYKTGDKGRIDEDGFLTIVDRYSRFAKIGGEMISLSAVETQVRALLDNTEVNLVAVNLPDTKKGEKIVLMIADDINASTLRQRLIHANFNSLMMPANIHKVDSVPTLGSGKTDFSAARQLALSFETA